MPEEQKAFNLYPYKEFVNEIRNLTNYLKSVYPNYLGEFRILQKGETSNEPSVLRLIHSVNTAFYDSDSDVIEGNWMFMLPPGYSFDGENQIVARINLDDMRDDIIKIGDLGPAIERIVSASVKILRVAQTGIQNDLPELTEEEMMPKLFIRISPMKTIDKATSAYRQIGDIAITPSIIVFNNENEIISRALMETELENLGKTLDEVIDIAIENTRKMLPVAFVSMSSNINDDAQIYKDVRSIPKNCSICVTNDKVTYGTSSLLYPGVLQDIYDAIGEYWIIFANEDQAHIFTKKEKKYTQMKTILANYRKFMTQTPPISDMVFTYVPGKGLVAYTPA